MIATYDDVPNDRSCECVTLMPISNASFDSKQQLNTHDSENAEFERT